MTDTAPLKLLGAAENEVHGISAFTDLGQSVVSPIAVFPPAVALGVVETLAAVVTRGHRRDANHQRDADGIVRAQMFEEGAVLMTAAPFDGFAADRYLMDFYDVAERDICSRMHFHTGPRLVRMMTGPGTGIRVSALSPLRISERAPAHDMDLRTFEDTVPADDPADPPLTRYNLIVPECAWIDMQVPRGTSHQFNAMGPHAVIDTVHPEESVEIFRERVGQISMMAQTIFLQQENPGSEDCALPQHERP